MASNRHLGRIVALQTLYEYDFRVSSEDSTADLDKILNRNVGRYKETIDDKTFIDKLVHDVDKNTKKLDGIIGPIAPEWPVEQIARIDKVVLRIALCELIVGDDVPPKVVINEAVELAKAFGGDNSSKFINGVLGTAFRMREEGKINLAKSSKKKKAPAKKQPTTKKKATKKTTKKTPAKKVAKK